MTRLFEDSSTARVFALPPGCDFLRALVSGLQDRLRGQPPEAIARVRIYLNTRRAARALHDRLSEGSPCLLPDIRVLAELASDPLVPAELAPPEPHLRRKLQLARLVGALLDAEPGLGPRSAMFELAENILRLLDEMAAAGVAAEALAELDVQDFSEHWARSLRFLTILHDSGATGALHGSEARLSAVATAFAGEWRQNPTETPIIIAGSTGSRRSTANFMRAVAALPQGAVILPGLDANLSGDAWQAVAEAPEHPQYGLARFLDSTDLRPGDIPTWFNTPPNAPHRTRLLSLALRPAPVTDLWFREGPALGREIAAATRDITLLEAAGPRQEAAAIALKLRGAVAEGKKAALVTPDRTLARRVGACLARWAIVPDDSAGRPLALTPPGTFLRLLAELPDITLSPVRFLALLKHPLVGGAGADRSLHLALTRRLELDILRGGNPVIDWSELSGWARSESLLETFPQAANWADWLKSTLASLCESTAMPLSQHLKRHRDAAEKLSSGMAQGPPGPVWQKEAGSEALKAIEELQAEAGSGGTLSAAEYRALLASHFAGIEVREDAFAPHPGIAIWGTLEARTQSADLVVLGGLNEGIWPPRPAPDPWLNRAMRASLGLSVPERRTGLSAHDFQQAASAGEIVLSRTVRADGAPTVPSRWLNRLGNLIGGLGETGEEALRGMRARGASLIAMAEVRDALADPANPAPRPAPVPPGAARPTRLSVTRIETLIRDPYAIYASSILRLRPLDAAGKRPDAKMRGTVIHAILEAFITETKGGWPENSREIFDAVTDRILARDVPWPSARHLWCAKLRDIAPWFLGTEAARRRSAVPLATEVRGSLRVNGTPLEFTLSANADRIDRMADGALAIYDYKSGETPTKNQIDNFAKQLLLEALIASEDGFAAVDGTLVGTLAYIGLGSGGKLREIDISPEMIAEVRAGLLRQITSFQSAETPFPARTRVQFLSYEGDFDQLSRLGEWRDGDPFVPQEVG